MKRKIILLIIGSLILTGCAFTDQAYQEKKHTSSQSSYLTSSTTQTTSNYNPLPTKRYTSTFPSDVNYYRDVAYSLEDLNFLVSSAVTRHLTNITVHCDFYHSLTFDEFAKNYIDNSNLVNITCSNSYLSGSKGYHTSYTFNFSYLPNPTYTTTGSGNNYESAKNLNYKIRKGSSYSYMYALPIESRSSIEVYDSEGIWWAVQNGLRPNCQTVYTENLYQTAKDLVKTLIHTNDDAYKIARNIYDYLVNECAYDYDCLSDSSSYSYTNTSYALEGVLNKKKAVCDGFSKAYVLLTGIAGVHSVRAFGFPTSSNVGHAWNYVCLDNNYYLVCATWGRIRKYIASRGKQLEFIDYSAFCASSSFFSSKGSYYNQLNTSIKASAFLKESPFENDAIDVRANFKIDSSVELVDVLSFAFRYDLDKGYINLENGNISVTKKIVLDALSTMGYKNYDALEYVIQNAYGGTYRTYYFFKK